MNLAQRLLRVLRPRGRSGEQQTSPTGRMLSQPPVNEGRLDHGAEALARDCDYALRIGREYLALMCAHDCPPAGRHVLEIGPGINYGATVVLACAGARISVTDRFPVGWRRPYHDRFYAALRGALAQDGTDVGALDRMLATGGFPADVLQELQTAVESLPVPDRSVDVTLSNAVLEHVVDPRAACAELFRVTRPGGMGFHQVDFRDHRDFARPLEYLLLEPEPFARMFAERHGECGGQTRAYELQALLVQAGFEVQTFTPNWFAEDAYLDEFIPRLRASGSVYRDCPRDALRLISGRFVLRRPMARG